MKNNSEYAAEAKKQRRFNGSTKLMKRISSSNQIGHWSTGAQDKRPALDK